MMKRRPNAILARSVLVILTIGAFGICASGASAKQVIWCFGDSLTEGIEGTTPYPKYLQRHLPSYTVVNQGKRGEKAVDGAKRLKRLLDSAKTKPNLVLLCEGANDRSAKTPANKIRDALNEMIVAAKVASAAVVIISQPDENNLLGVSPPYYAQLALRHEVPIAEEVLNGIYRETTLLKRPYTLAPKDPRHLSSKGNEVFAERLFLFLKLTGLLASLETRPFNDPVTFRNSNSYDVRICVYNLSDTVRAVPLKTWLLKKNQTADWSKAPTGFHVKAFRAGLVDTLIATKTNVTAARTISVSGSQINVTK